MTSNWNPEQYDKFKDQRSRPFFDLLGMIERKPMYSGIDLGCGTGALTRMLFDELKLKKMIGVDSSSTMLASAAKYAIPGLEFKLADILAVTPEEPYELVFSNAALQWVNDHETLLPKILSWVSPGGQIAIQVPSNNDHPSHRIAWKVAAELFPKTFGDSAGAEGFGTLSVERYAEILNAHGFSDPRARVEVYGHALPSGQSVVEWVKGTLLTRFQAKLSSDDFAKFLNQYEKELLEVIGSGPYFYAFKRTLFWGKKRAR